MPAFYHRGGGTEGAGCDNRTKRASASDHTLAVSASASSVLRPDSKASDSSDSINSRRFSMPITVDLPPDIARKRPMIIAILLAAHDPAAVARSLPFAHDAMLELRREAGAISDPALRAAVETQILAPWLPEQAWAYAHLAEAGKRLNEAELVLPPPHKGDFAAAPGGPCEDGHHGYPGGLAVHSLANLLHARALADVYRHVYKVQIDGTVLTVAAIWH